MPTASSWSATREPSRQWRRWPRPPRSIQGNDLGALDRITGVAEVADGEHSAFLPAEQHEVGRLSLGIVDVAGDDRGLPLDKAQAQAPVLGLRIPAEITGNLLLAAHARAVDEVEPDF